MKACWPLLVALLSGCASVSTPVPDRSFFASGFNPSWTLSMTAQEIRLAVTPTGRNQTAPPETLVFPMVAPQQVGDVSVWDSVGANQQIRIEVRHAPCRVAGGTSFPDSVHVMLGARSFNGCGSRQLMGMG